MAQLRIAQIGSIWERTPPQKYGGTERVVSDLTENLLTQGHKVTLFATGDSKTSARLAFTSPRALYRRGIPWNNYLYPLRHMAAAFERAGEFDVLHVHLNTQQDYAALPFARLVKTPVLITLHFMLPTKSDQHRRDRYDFLMAYTDLSFVSISRAQQTLPLNFIGNVYNGLNFPKINTSKNRPKFLLWLGRICREKGTREAIVAATRARQPLILAGKVDEYNTEYKNYFYKEVKPLLKNRLVKFIGEVNDRQKYQLLKNSIGLLMPINWNEPFGLAVIEAQAAGVPVIAFNRGPMKELIDQNKTGLVVKNLSEMAKVLRNLPTFNANYISAYAQKNFSAQRMASDYLNIYQDLTRPH